MGFTEPGYVGPLGRRAKQNAMSDADREHLARIERKLDTLIAVLAADEEQELELSDLEGRQFGGERDSTQSLD